MDIDNIIIKDIELRKIAYFFMTLGYRLHDGLTIQRNKEDKRFSDKLEIAYKIIDDKLSKDEGIEKSLYSYINSNEPYLKMLLSNNLIPFNLAVLCLLMNSININDAIGGCLEVLPKEADERYNIVELGKGEIFNHEGVIYNEKFYYFSPTLLQYQRVQSEPVELVKLLSEANCKNTVWLRLDDNLSVPLSHYKSSFRSFSALFRGKIIDVDNLEFPYYHQNIILAVYNPKTMKKIQFKISHRKDDEKWIEVEELFPPSNKSSGKLTKYLHSIYDSDKESFFHVDGSLNYYSASNYKNRVKTGINAHANKHEKLWLIEGEITKSEWVKLIYRFFDDDDLVSDAFKGRLSEDVLEEIL